MSLRTPDGKKWVQTVTLQMTYDYFVNGRGEITPETLEPQAGPIHTSGPVCKNLQAENLGSDGFLQTSHK